MTSSTASRTSAYSIPPPSSTAHPASGTQRVRPANPAIVRLRPVSIAVDAPIASPVTARTSGREAFNAVVLFASLCVGTMAVAAAVIVAFFR